MGASKFTNAERLPRVKMQIMVKDMVVCCRFFDGYDWNEVPKKRTPSRGGKDGIGGSKAGLMGELLGNDPEDAGDKMFRQPTGRCQCVADRGRRTCGDN